MAEIYHKNTSSISIEVQVERKKCPHLDWENSLQFLAEFGGPRRLVHCETIENECFP